MSNDSAVTRLWIAAWSVFGADSLSDGKTVWTVAAIVLNDGADRVWNFSEIIWNCHINHLCI